MLDEHNDKRKLTDNLQILADWFSIQLSRRGYCGCRALIGVDFGLPSNEKVQLWCAWHCIMGTDTWHYYREDEEAVKSVHPRHVTKYCFILTLMNLKTSEALYVIAIKHSHIHKEVDHQSWISRHSITYPATHETFYNMIDSCVISLPVAPARRNTMVSKITQKLQWFLT